MERQQLFHVSNSCSIFKKIKNPNKRKECECECQQAEREVFAGSQPLFNEHPFWFKKPKTSSGIGSIVLDSRNPGRVSKEPELCDENWVFKNTVRVWDLDTESMHQLVFKRWSTSKSYIFNDGWTKHFVKRRNLVEGDEIGLYWDNDQSRLQFSVLSRAAATGR
ncbi:hypothetical protein D5086_007497 [Populus alba]|uniref:Uncharacterized protein n=1 Tax=Populus alba TaxID=43335 RepID=A0ACC4CNK8_POPAL